MKQLINTLAIVLLVWSCTSNKTILEEPIIISTSPQFVQTQLEIEFRKGKEHNQPSFAIWTEDTEGNYIETLFVTNSVGSGFFKRGEIEPGKWKNEPGSVRRPASLPYWAHKRNQPAKDGLLIPDQQTAVPDAISGATPQSNFILQTGTRIKAKEAFVLLFEINQPWDSNDFWTNSKYPGDSDYATSLQPALVYSVTIKLSGEKESYELLPIGHSHPSGKDGKLNADISTLTTAKNIVERIAVTLK